MWRERFIAFALYDWMKPWGRRDLWYDSIIIIKWQRERYIKLYRVWLDGAVREAWLKVSGGMLIEIILFLHACPEKSGPPTTFVKNNFKS